MNFITEFIMGVVILGIVILGVVAYTIIFNVISRQLNELCERINNLEDEVYGEEDDDPCDSDGNPIILIDDEDKDLEEGDV